MIHALTFPHAWPYSRRAGHRRDCRGCGGPLPTVMPRPALRGDRAGCGCSTKSAHRPDLIPVFLTTNRCARGSPLCTGTGIVLRHRRWRRHDAAVRPASLAYRGVRAGAAAHRPSITPDRARGRVDPNRVAVLPGHRDLQNVGPFHWQVQRGAGTTVSSGLFDPSNSDFTEHVPLSRATRRAVEVRLTTHRGWADGVPGGSRDHISVHAGFRSPPLPNPGLPFWKSGDPHRGGGHRKAPSSSSILFCRQHDQDLRPIQVLVHELALALAATAGGSAARGHGPMPGSGSCIRLSARVPHGAGPWRR